MNTIKVHFSNDDSIITRINADEKEIAAFCKVGSTRNLGAVKDDMQPIVAVEILREIWFSLMDKYLKADIESVLKELPEILNSKVNISKITQYLSNWIKDAEAR